MTPDQIAAWAASGESEMLEFKRTTGERREATRTLCAMLNHRRRRVAPTLNGRSRPTLPCSSNWSGSRRWVMTAAPIGGL